MLLGQEGGELDLKDKKTQTKTLIIDCNSLAYKFVYNMTELEFKKSKTNVIFGFLGQLRILAERFNTCKFIFCWDSRQSYRKLAYPEYKRRPIDPSKKEIIEQAYVQFDLLYEKILPSLGFKNVFRQSGYEADDLMAWVAARFPDYYIIVSKDEDMLQLLYEDKYKSVEIYNLDKFIKALDFMHKYGLEPRKWADVKSIAGCSSDNVKGIPGVGKESAIKYLNGVLKEGKVKAKIESEEGKRIIQECFDLVVLPYNGDRPIEMELAEDEKFYSLDFMDAFKEFGCASFVQKENFDKWRIAFNLIRGRE